ncbi:MAG TPA: AMP-binding protein, partial [Pantoea agglomerans]|nr:AMP-binding protein [Pantoea agglomerans]
MRVTACLSGDDREVAWRGDQRLVLSVMHRQVVALRQRLAAQPGRHWALCFVVGYRFCVALVA